MFSETSAVVLARGLRTGVGRLVAVRLVDRPFAAVFLVLGKRISLPLLSQKLLGFRSLHLEARRPVNRRRHRQPFAGVLALPSGGHGGGGHYSLAILDLVLRSLHFSRSQIRQQGSFRPVENLHFVGTSAGLSQVVTCVATVQRFVSYPEVVGPHSQRKRLLFLGRAASRCRLGERRTLGSFVRRRNPEIVPRGRARFRRHGSRSGVERRLSVRRNSLGVLAGFEHGEERLGLGKNAIELVLARERIPGRARPCGVQVTGLEHVGFVGRRGSVVGSFPVVPVASRKSSA